MRLLDQSVTQDIRGQETARYVMRIEEIKAQLVEYGKKLSNAEADFKNALNKHHEVWQKEIEEQNEWKKQTEAEIKVLEDRRNNLLVPIGILNKGAQDIMNEAELALRSAKKREQDAQELIERLEDKLDDVGQREIDVEKQIQKIAS